MLTDNSSLRLINQKVGIFLQQVNADQTQKPNTFQAYSFDICRSIAFLYQQVMLLQLYGVGVAAHGWMRVYVSCTC